MRRPAWVTTVVAVALVVGGCASAPAAGGDRPRAVCLDEPRSVPGSRIGTASRPLIFLLCIQTQ